MKRFNNVEHVMFTETTEEAEIILAALVALRTLACRTGKPGGIEGA